MLSFISFWRAAAIVLSDLASSAYYVGGIAETAIGKSAPWFILGIMLFSYACVPSISKAAACSCAAASTGLSMKPWAATLAKFSVSALMFDYVSDRAHQRGQRRALSRRPDQRIHRLLPSSLLGCRSRPHVAAGFSVLVTLYFWRKNIIGIEESRKKPCGSCNHHRDGGHADRLVPHHDSGEGLPASAFPPMSNIKFGPDALGWLKGTGFSAITRRGDFWLASAIPLLA